MVIDKNESMLFQALADTMMVTELQCKGFLHSEYYHSLDFSEFGNGERGIKSVLEANDSILNPAFMQMFLYALLVIPREIYDNQGELCDSVRQMVNQFVSNKAVDIRSNYKEDQKEMNFFRHLRNAIAHGRCSFPYPGEPPYVLFTDKNGNKSSCQFKISFLNMGELITEIQKTILDYLKKQSGNKE